MILYTIGCSHTFGNACAPKEHSWSNILFKHYLKNDYYKINPTIDSNMEGNILFNHATPGAGNDYIFHKSLESIEKLISIDRKPNYVIVQWSGPSRRMHCTVDGEYLYVNPYDWTELGVKFEPMGSQHTLHYIFSLQEYLKKNNIEYIFFNYIEIDRTILNSPIYDCIDFSRWLKFDVIGENILFKGLGEFLKKNGMSCDELGHPNLKGYHLISQEIASKMGIDLIDINLLYKSILI